METIDNGLDSVEARDFATVVLSRQPATEVSQTDKDLPVLLQGLGTDPTSQDLIAARPLLAKYRAIFGQDRQEFCEKLTKEELLTIAIADLLARTRYVNEDGDGEFILRKYKDYLETVGLNVEGLTQGNRNTNRMPTFNVAINNVLDSGKQ